MSTTQEIKAIVDTTKPVTEWHMTATVQGNSIIVKDRKGKTAATLDIDPSNGKVSGKWQAGHSLTRNELSARLGI
jgi:hypothetical protein